MSDENEYRPAHAMPDLETVGTGSRAPIIAIGAVAFDPIAGTLGSEFYVNVDLQSCLDVGAVVDGGAFYFWLQQTEAARRALYGDRVPIQLALQWYSTWLKGLKEREEQRVLMWGNGAGFDNVILENHYAMCGMEPPWKFYENRCFRTLRQEYPDIEMVRIGEAHNALDDAKTQANHAIKLYAFKRAQAERLAFLEKSLGKVEVASAQPDPNEQRCGICGGAMGNPYGNSNIRCLDLSCPG